MSITHITGGLTSREEQSPRRSQMIPGGAVLDTWCDEPWTNGVQIEQLGDLQRLRVRTRNSWYEITVIDRWAGEIAICGGQFFPRVTLARLSGATFGGSILKMRGIYIGLQMEIDSEQGRLLTTRVKLIIVEKLIGGQKLLF